MTAQPTDRIRHAPDCRQPDPYETTGRLGDPMTRCRTCGRFYVAPAAPTTTEATEATADDADRIRHAPDCAGPDLFQTVGRLGDTITRCGACGRFYVTGGTAPSLEMLAPRDRSGVRPGRFVGFYITEGHRARTGDEWPTHRGRARKRRSRANRKPATR